MSKTVTIDNQVYVITDPIECTHPKGTRIEEIIYDDNTWVLARIKYRGEKPAIGFRWHVSDREKEKKTNKEKCIGYPNSHNQPTWQVLPINILDAIQQYLLRDRQNGETSPTQEKTDE